MFAEKCERMIDMEHIHFTMKEHGFAGHMAVPEKRNGKAVIVLSGGEKFFCRA